MLTKLSSYNWDDIGKKMYLVAIYWAKVTFKGRWDNLPKGYTIEDIVHEAIRRAFEREWEEIEQRLVIDYLFGAVRSVISNLARDYYSHNTQNFSELSVEDGEKRTSFDIADKPSGDNNLGHILDFKYFISEIQSRINGNRKLEMVFEDIRLGYLPREISKRRELNIREVYNLNKRLVRIVDDIAVGNG